MTIKLEDTLGAFTCGVRLTDPSNFTFESYEHRNDKGNLLIELESSTPPFLGPLSGMKFVIKETFSLRGLALGAGSKDYASIMPPADETAEVVMLLIRAGATLVGRTKSSKWGASDPFDPATPQDYQIPLNPRGNHLSPGSSSHGSAVAVGGYDLIDFSCGTDFTGSIRGPAARQSLFSYRSSRGSVPSEGIFLQSRDYETVGIFARNPAILSEIGTLCIYTHPRIQPVQSSIRKIKVIEEWYKGVTPEQTDLTTNFIRELEGRTKIPVEFVNLKAGLDSRGYNEKQISAEVQFFKNVVGRDSWETKGADFRTRWKAAGNDWVNFKAPTVWQFDEKSYKSWTPAERRSAVEGLEISLAGRIKDWLVTSGTVLLYSSQDPRHRFIEFDSIDRLAGKAEMEALDSSYKEIWNSSSYVNGLTRGLEATIAGLSDAQIPIGRTDVHERDERVTVLSLMGHPGEDHLLLGLVSFLSEVGLLKEVKAGPRAFPLPGE